MTGRQCEIHPKALMDGVECSDCVQAKATLSFVEKMWDRFVERCALKTFGEAAIITEGKKQRNFVGSVDSYKKIFMEVTRDHLPHEGK